MSEKMPGQEKKEMGNMNELTEEEQEIIRRVGTPYTGETQEFEAFDADDTIPTATTKSERTPVNHGPMLNVGIGEVGQAELQAAVEEARKKQEGN